MDAKDASLDANGSRIDAKSAWKRSILFSLCFLVLFYVCNIVLLPKADDMWQSRKVIDGFYETPKSSIDLLALGSSQVLVGLSAMELYNQNGFAAYSLATENQTLFMSYYLLQECLQYHQPQVVVLEVQMLFSDTTEPYYHKVFDYMRWSPVKWAGIQDYLQTYPESSLANFIFPAIVFHYRWKDLSVTDFTYFFKDKYDPSRGFVMLHEKSNIVNFYGYNDALVNVPEENFSINAIAYLEKMIAFCFENDIQLILIKNPTTVWSTAQHLAVDRYASTHDLAFIDFNDHNMLQKMNLNYANDANDKGHMNVIGAIKVTDYLSAYLKANTKLPDRRGDKAFDFLNKDLTQYLELAKEQERLLQ